MAGNSMSSKAPSSGRRALIRGHYKALRTEERSVRSQNAGQLNLSGPTLLSEGAALLEKLDQSDKEVSAVNCLLKVVDLETRTIK